MGSSIREVVYTARLIEPDAEDSISGWWAPDWSLFEVDDDPGYAQHDTYPADEAPAWWKWRARRRHRAEWLADTLKRMVGHCEPDSSVGIPRWFSASDTIDDFRTGIAVIPEAHPEGFTPKEVIQAARLLKADGILHCWDGV